MFEYVTEFEKHIAEFFGSPYAVATDCCTHAVELCLRYQNVKRTTVPNRTYVSIPMTLEKLSIDWSFNTEEWKDYYQLKGTNIFDAAVLWKKNSYIPNTLMCLSFQYRKHLSLGRGGIILTDNLENAEQLRCMSYDGRERHTRWIYQNINTIGYHYYMTPETAKQGLELLPDAKNKTPKIWSYLDYPDISKFKVFDEKNLFQ